MDITISSSNSESAIYKRTDTDEPLYRVESPIGLSSDCEKSTIFKFSEHKRGERKIGQIELSSYLPDVVRVRGRDITPHRKNRFRMKTFQASDGRSYGWKISQNFSSCIRYELVPSDSPKSVIARYSDGSQSFFGTRAVTFSIAPEGLRMLDDIIITFEYSRQYARRRDSLEAGSV